MSNSNKFIRLSTILGDPKATPPREPLVPVCRATWYAGIKQGTYPAPIKLSPRVSVWRASDIYALIDNTNLEK